MSAHLGQIAALCAAFCWAVTALASEAAGRRVGSLPLNLVRLPIAFAFLALAGWISRGVPLPVDASPHAWLWLTVSGLIGFSFGDLCLYRAYLLIGPRLSTLLMSLVPPLTALIGWAVLGETLSGRDLLGMALTMSGIAWAVLDRKPAAPSGSLPVHASPAGLALGLGGALGQSCGLVLSKYGMGGYSPFPSNQIRVVAGFVGFSLIVTALRMWPRVGMALRDGKALGFAALAAFFGPFIAVSLALVAIRATAAGVAASIMATTPIVIIPLVVLLRRERVGPGGVGGAVLAVAGVALLFL
ncbi:MAG TPA: DMT family transporter [Thermoanaerobaculia bacterium]|nr:DMT family transporter [Thermoanaerobaculia bacterium]